MATGFENKERNVIPNWRSFQVTASLGEISTFSKTKQDVNPSLLQDQIDDWNFNRNIGIAADLVSSAFTLNKKDIPEVNAASKFILDNPHLSNEILDSIAKKIINSNSNTDNEFNIEVGTFDTLIKQNNLDLLYEKVRINRHKTVINPYNPIPWVELSRFHLILGNLEKAKSAMLVAYSLSKNNRFILRSLARLLTRLDENSDTNVELAHNALRKADNLLSDPWLLATEIGLATKRNRSSRFIKQAFQIVNSKNYSDFELSELNSALATVELKSGNHKKSKELFFNSLKKPNDNALAQAEWVSEKERIFDRLNPESFNVKRSFEALAIDLYHKEKWNDALYFVKKWFLDMPFSKRSILYGHHIAGVYLKDYKTSIDFCKVGLISHPNDKMLMNDLAYSLCLNNELVQAESILTKALSTPEDNEVNKTCLIATKGLLEFRKGNIDAGRKFYLEAAEKAKGLNNKYMLSLAVLNYTREEVRVRSDYGKGLIERIDTFVKGLRNKDLHLLKDEIKESYNKNYR